MELVIINQIEVSMKKLVYLFSLFCIISSFAFSQTLYTNVWEKSKVKSNYPKYLDSTGNNTRALSYGKVGGNDRLFICTRNISASVIVLNAATGDSVGKLDVTGVTGGTYALSDVEVSSDGVVYSCNLSLGSGSDTMFTVYKWSTETSTPVKAISYRATFRLGDKLTVVGSTTDNSIIIYVAAASTNKLVRFTTTDNGATFTPEVVTLSNGNSGGSPSVGPVSLGANSDFYVKSVGKNLYRFDKSGNILDTLSGSIIATGSSAVRAFSTGVNKYVAVYNYGSGNENIRLVDVSNGVPSSRMVFITPSLGSSSNSNGTGDISLKDNGDGTFDLFVLGTNNGFGCYRTRNLNGASPFTVAMDGLNMFTEGANLMGKGGAANHYFAFDKDYFYFGFAHNPLSLDTLDIRVWIATYPLLNTGAKAAPFGAITFDSTFYTPNYSVFLENGFYSEIRKWNGTAWSGDLGFVGSADRFGGWSGNTFFSELRVRRDSVGNPANIAYAVTVEKEDNSGLFTSFPIENGTNTSVKYFYVFKDLGNGVVVRQNNAATIPVELSSFSASVSGKVVNLNWATATEKNNNGFSIERSSNGKDFSAIQFVKGKGTTTVQSKYSFTDNNVASGNYYYRLRQIDYDGSISYSKTVEVNVTVNPNTFELSQNYPNPFNPSTNIKFTSGKSGNASVKVFNTLGQEVATIFNSNVEAGKAYEINFDASKLTSGIYFYQLKEGKNMLTKKMLLIK
jgi:hypothetical protein